VASNRTDLGGPGEYDLYQATRASTAAAWSGLALLANVNDTGTDTKPALMPDGLQLFFSSDRSGGGTGYDIYLATRTRLEAAFGAPVLVTAVSSTVADLVGSVTPDGKQLYFDRATSGTGRDIYVQDLASIQPPTSVSELNSKYDDGHALVSGDLLTVYWASTRVSLTADSGSAEANVLVAHRTTPTGPFSGLAMVTDVNTTSAEFPSYLSPDGCTIYIDSNRSGRQHLWVARKPAPASGAASP
jgi:Tol biopolymer transport system component